MFCSNCGKKINPESKFCFSCGNKTDSLKIPNTIPNNQIKPTFNSPDLNWLSENEELGKFWPRFGAYIFDYSLAGLGGGLALGLILGFINPDTAFFETLSPTADRYLTFSCVIIYHILCLSFFSTTLGKKIYGLRVVDEITKDKISTPQAIKRSLSYILSSILFGIGFFRIINNPNKQGWHEEIAKTFVVRNKSQSIIPGVILSIIAIIFLISVNFW